MKYVKYDTSLLELFAFEGDQLYVVNLREPDGS